MKIVIQVLVIAVAFGAGNALRRTITPAPDINSALFDDTEFVYSKDIKDTGSPSTFVGDPMQAKTKDAFNERSKDRYHNAYGTANGIEVEAVGKLKETETGKAFVVSGSYSYTGADGKRYRVRYTADEFGYHPKTELEVDFPDPIETNRVGRTGDGLDKLQRLSNRNQFDPNSSQLGKNNGKGNNDGSSNNSNGQDGKNLRNGQAKPTKSSSGYAYDKPADVDRIYLPPLDVRSS